MRMATSSGALRSKAAAEIRAEMGRQHLTQSGLATRLNKGQPWVSRRIGENADTPINLDDLEEFAAALNVPATQLLGWPGTGGDAGSTYHAATGRKVNGRPIVPVPRIAPDLVAA